MENDLLNKFIGEASMAPTDRLLEIHRDCSRKSTDLYAYRMAIVGMSIGDPHFAMSLFSMASEIDDSWEPLRKAYLGFLTENFKRVFEKIINE